MHSNHLLQKCDTYYQFILDLFLSLAGLLSLYQEGLVEVSSQSVEINLNVQMGLIQAPQQSNDSLWVYYLGLEGLDALQDTDSYLKL